MSASWRYTSQVTHALDDLRTPVLWSTLPRRNGWPAMIAARGLGDIVNVPVLCHRSMVSHIVLTMVLYRWSRHAPSGARASIRLRARPFPAPRCIRSSTRESLASGSANRRVCTNRGATCDTIDCLKRHVCAFVAILSDECATVQFTHTGDQS